jgi:hypothetical protein
MRGLIAVALVALGIAVGGSSAATTESVHEAVTAAIGRLDDRNRPFAVLPISPGTGGEQQKPTLGATSRMCQERLFAAAHCRRFEKTGAHR